MKVIEADTAHEAYRPVLNHILKEGYGVTTQYGPTIEALNVATVIRQPWEHVTMVPGRYANPWVALSESLWVLAGRNDVAALLPYNKRIADFSDDGEIFYGAYGYRIKGQLKKVVNRLRQDSSDRRAFLLISRPKDLFANTKDPPCNMVATFKIRQGKLHMTVFCRSNDVHWGLFAVNLPEFGILQEFIAARVGVHIGTQTHISNSLHAYLHGPGGDITNRMVHAWDEPLPKMPPGRRLFLPPISTALHDLLLDELWNIFSGQGIVTDHPALCFAEDFLRWYREERAYPYPSPNSIRYSWMYPDWIKAGQHFLEWLNRDKR